MGLLQPLPLPDHCWEQVSHDLVTGLPKTPRGYDIIITFVYRLSKRILLVPTTSTIDAVGYARLFFNNIFRHFGLPRVLVSDKDPCFTLNFWRALCKRLGTNLNMSTSHHPQTDGQTERANRMIEDMLKAYVAPHQSDWDEHLIAAEFAYNNSVQASTGSTPFYLNHGRHPHTPLSLAVADNQPRHAQVLSPVAYKLKLPSSMKCHPVFHISLLQPADTESALFPEREQPAPPPVRVDNNQAYFTIDYIMGHEPKTARSHEEARKYLIKWEGYPLWEATKEPAKNIHKDVPHVVEDY
jgi:hypothetical protein